MVESWYEWKQQRHFLECKCPANSWIQSSSSISLMLFFTITTSIWWCYNLEFFKSQQVGQVWRDYSTANTSIWSKWVHCFHCKGADSCSIYSYLMWRSCNAFCHLLVLQISVQNIAHVVCSGFQFWIFWRSRGLQHPAAPAQEWLSGALNSIQVLKECKKGIPYSSMVWSWPWGTGRKFHCDWSWAYSDGTIETTNMVCLPSQGPATDAGPQHDF
jgi:hypothetical protein